MPKRFSFVVLPGLALGLALLTMFGDAAFAARKVNVGVLKISGVANAWIAKQQGMYDRNGLDANLVEFRSGADAVNALQSGSVDIVLSIAGSAMPAMERGFDLTAIFQNETGRSSPPDSGSIQVQASSPIKSLSGLAGKKIGVQSLNSQQVIGVQVVLKRAGVDLKSVNFVEMPFPALPNALRAGQVDAVSLVDPFTTQLIISGAGRVLSWSYVESIPDQPLGAWFAKRSYVAKNPEIIEAFNKTMKESIDYMNADEDRTRSEVATFTGLPAEVVKSMPVPHLDYKIDLANWQKTIDMMKEYGVLQSSHKPEEFFADQIKPYIAR
jgi:NitT/TauT family transport system substrate-binding protein